MKTSWLILFLLVSIFAHSQVRFDNLDSFLDYVSKNNTVLRSELLNEEIAQELTKAAWAPVMPQVKAFSRFDNNISLPVQLVPAQFLGGQEGEFAEVQFGTRYNTTYGVEASLALLNISNWKNISTTNFAAKAATHQVKDRELYIREQATTTYYLTLLSKEAVNLSYTILESTDSLLRAAEVRFKNGMIEQMELNRVKALHIESLNQFLSNEAMLKRNMNSIKNIAAIETDSVILSEKNFDLGFSVRNPDEFQIETIRLPRYRSLASRTEQARAELTRQHTKLLPEISLYARYARQSFNNDLMIFSNDLPWYEVGLVSLRAEWSLFTGWNRKSSIRRAALQSELAHEELKSYKLQADKENQDLIDNYKTSAKTLSHAFEHLNVNQANYSLAALKYNEGVYTIDQYITIYQELTRSQNQYLSNLANYMVFHSILTSKKEFTQNEK